MSERLKEILKWIALVVGAVLFAAASFLVPAIAILYGTDASDRAVNRQLYEIAAQQRADADAEDAGN